MRSGSTAVLAGSARATSIDPAIGVVVIARNEGERLRRCLASLVGRAARIVYVDSGSTDGSQSWASSQGVEVIDLDLSRPFTMARGRNAGWRRHEQLADGVEFIQFVDGDCEVCEGWIEEAAEVLRTRPEITAVFGRRRERSPQRSIYNALADLEWEGRPGEVLAFGGDVMIRLDALRRLGGFNEGMIAGEEPELSVRVRGIGGRILRVDREMTRHDAAMTRFGQWWRRTRRTGHAYAEGSALHGRGPSRHNRKALRSAIAFGGVMPVLLVAGVLAGLLLDPRWFLVPAVGGTVVAVWILRIALHRRRSMGTPWRLSLALGLFTMLAKPAHLLGAIQFWLGRARGRQVALIEYKQG